MSLAPPTVPSAPITPRHILPPKDFNMSTTSSIKRGLHVLAGEGSDPKTISGTAKVVRSVVQSMQFFKVFTPLKVLVFPLSFLADVIKIAGCFETINKISDQLDVKIKKGDKAAQAERILKIASGVFSFSNVTLTGVKVLDALGLIKVAATLGRIPVIRVFAPLFPLSSAMALTDLLGAPCEIGISGIKLHRISKQTKALKERQKQWAQDIKPLALEKKSHAEQKLAKIAPKSAKASQKVTETGTNIQECSQDYAEHQAKRIQKKEELKESNAFLRPFKRIQFLLTGIGPHKTTRKLRTAYKMHDTAWNKFKAFENYETKLEGKRAFYEKINESADLKPYEVTLKNFQKQKIEKARVKIINLRWDTVKEGISIVLSTALIILSIASIVLVPVLYFTGVGALPATVLLTLGFLALSTGMLGRHLFNKHKKPKPIHSIKPPLLGVPLVGLAQTAQV